MRPYLLALLIVAVWPVSAALAARAWRDAQGKTIQGDFVRIFNGDVVIQRPNKSVVKVPYWNLSEEDREYVKEQLEEKGQGNLIPPEPQRNTNPGGGVPGAPGFPGPGAPGGIGPGIPGGIGPGGIGPGAAPGFPSPPGAGSTPGFPPGITAPMPGDPGASTTPPTTPGLPGSPYSPGGPGFPGPRYTPPTSPPSSSIPGSTPGSIPGMPGYPPGMGPGSGSTPMPGMPGSPGYGSSPGMTPPRFEVPTIKYDISCRRCGHTWTSDTPDVFAPCPRCGVNGPTGNQSTGSASTYPSSSPAPYSNPQDDGRMAARQAGVITGVVLMLACPIVVGILMILALVAVIYFVVKAVSSPGPAPVRRHY